MATSLSDSVHLIVDETSMIIEPSANLIEIESSSKQQQQQQQQQQKSNTEESSKTATALLNDYSNPSVINLGDENTRSSASGANNVNVSASVAMTSSGAVLEAKMVFSVDSDTQITNVASNPPTTGNASEEAVINGKNEPNSNSTEPSVAQPLTCKWAVNETECGLTQEESNDACSNVN